MKNVHNVVRQVSQRKKGFTLVEVLIFTLLISFLFIALIILSVNSLFQTKVNEHKILATYYAEELREWLRSQKDADWNAFIAQLASNSYGMCFLSTPSSWNGPACPSTGCPTTCAFTLGDSPNQIFQRYALYSVGIPIGNLSEEVRVEITVVWREGGRTFTVPLYATFTQFD